MPRWLGASNTIWKCNYGISKLNSSFYLRTISEYRICSHLLWPNVLLRSSVDDRVGNRETGGVDEKEKGRKERVVGISEEVRLEVIANV